MPGKLTNKDQNASLTHDTQILKTVLFKYLQLHEELNQRSMEITEHIKAQTQEHAKLMKAWREGLIDASHLEEKIHTTTHHLSLYKLSEMCSKLENQLRKNIDQRLAKYEHEFKSQVFLLKRQVELAQSVLSTEYWQERLMTLGMTLVCSLFISWLILPKPTLPLSNEQLADYTLGHSLRENSRKLSPSTRQELQSLCHVQLPKPKPYRHPNVPPSIQEMLGQDTS